jgi:CubicO group peptidase (beta-lactamase class C family)
VKRARTVLLVLVLALASRTSTLGAQDLAAAADRVFAPYAAATVPGCVVGVDRGDTPLLRRAYGMAELEHGVPLDTASILEAGSVSKQFTAAAVLLLAARGTVSLDDPVQRWFPELPVYPWPVTVRHLMLHASGLRDWGSVASIAGWPRGSRAHTHGDALAILARQPRLNHEPGAEFSYTNSGYNLMAMLVERATGTSFADFTRREFFVPLGMTHTSWRDDYTRLVRGRAQAYALQRGAWHLDMPFEFVHGNGGLLTTVGDLLSWTRALHQGRIGSPDVSAAMLQAGRFNDGRAMEYGGGLFIGAIRGVQAVYHGGATAGYRSVLARFTDSDIRLAILCNRGDANPPALALNLLGDLLPFESVAPADQVVPTPFRADTARFEQYVGSWTSTEADGTLRILVRNGALMAERRPGEAGMIRATAADEFSAPGGVQLRFERDATGRPVRLLVTVSRAIDVRFDRDDP